MPYVKFDWVGSTNGPLVPSAGATAITDARLDHLETQYDEVAAEKGVANGYAALDTDGDAVNAANEKLLTVAGGDAAYAPLPGAALFIPATSFALRSGVASLNSVTASRIPAWSLDPSTSEGVAAMLRIPEGWTTFSIKWLGFNPGAGAGVVALSRAVFSTGGDGAAIFTSHDLVAATTSNVTVLGQDVRQAFVTDTPLTVPAGRSIGVLLTRLGADAADTLSGDWNFMGIELTRLS